MSQRILRPLSYGDLFDELFDLYRNNFLLFAGIGGIIFIPLSALSYATGQLGQSIFALITAILSGPIMAATTWAVSKSYLGETPTIAESYKAIGHMIIPFILTLIVAYFIIGIGFLLLIIPGFIFSFWYAFLSGVCVIEGKSGSEARQRSKELADGNWGRIFVVALCAVILYYIVTMIVSLATLPILGFSLTTIGTLGGIKGFIYGLINGTASAVVSPIPVLAFVLLYYDVRVRKEGFDIQMLAESMGSEQSTPPSEINPL